MEIFFLDIQNTDYSYYLGLYLCKSVDDTNPERPHLVGALLVVGASSAGRTWTLQYQGYRNRTETHGQQPDAPNVGDSQYDEVSNMPHSCSGVYFYSIIIM